MKAEEGSLGWYVKHHMIVAVKSSNKMPSENLTHPKELDDEKLNKCKRKAMNADYLRQKEDKTRSTRKRCL